MNTKLICSRGSESFNANALSSPPSSASGTGGGAAAAFCVSFGVSFSTGAGAATDSAAIFVSDAFSHSSSSPPPLPYIIARTSGYCINASGSSNSFTAFFRSPPAITRVAFHKGSSSSIASSPSTSSVAAAVGVGFSTTGAAGGADGGVNEEAAGLNEKGFALGFMIYDMSGYEQSSCLIVDKRVR